MLWYIKTQCPDDVLLELFRRAIKIENYYNQIYDIKLLKWLKNKKVNPNNIYKYICRNIRVKEAENNIHQIYINNEVLSKDLTLKELLQMIEYGSVEIKPTKIISRWITRAKRRVQNDLGGI